MTSYVAFGRHAGYRDTGDTAETSRSDGDSGVRQFDAFKGVYKRGRLHYGNRGPLQWLKRWLVARKFRGQMAEFNKAGFEPLPTLGKL